MLDYDLKPRVLRSPISVINDAKYRYEIVLVVKCARFCSAYTITYRCTAVITVIYVRQVLVMSCCSARIFVCVVIVLLGLLFLNSYVYLPFGLINF